MRNMIPCFTKDEIDVLIDKCNFTEQEQELFNLRNSEMPYEECAEIMNVSVSTVYRIGKKMNRKINHVRLIVF